MPSAAQERQERRLAQLPWKQSAVSQIGKRTRVPWLGRSALRCLWETREQASLQRVALEAHSISRCNSPQMERTPVSNSR